MKTSHQRPLPLQGSWTRSDGAPVFRQCGAEQPQVMPSAATTPERQRPHLHKGWETAKGVAGLGSVMWTTLLLFSLAR